MNCKEIKQKLALSTKKSSNLENKHESSISDEVNGTKSSVKTGRQKSLGPAIDQMVGTQSLLIKHIELLNSDSISIKY